MRDVQPGSPLPTLASGIPGLDHVTGGGLPQGEVTLLAGTTGTGKSVMAAQFLVSGVTDAAQAGVFVTTEERPEKIRRVLGTLGWDVRAWEAQGRWAFVDASAGAHPETVLGDELDLSPLITRIGRAVERIGAKRVVIDSLSHLFARLGDRPSVRAELHRLIGSLEDLDVTAIVTVERDHEYDGVGRFGVEEFVADNILILRNVFENERRRRTIEPLKFRGTPHRCGEFPFVILADRGVAIVALSELQLAYSAPEERLSFSNPGIDAMLGGGPLRGSAILVSGPTGTGKSLLGLEFLAGAGEGERGLLVNFEESGEQVARNARHWGYDLDALQSAGRLRVMCQYPESTPIANHLVAIQHALDEFRPTRVVVDSLSAVERGASPRAFFEFLLGLSTLLKAHSTTGLFTTTTQSLLGGPSATGVEASTLLDTIVLLRYVEVYGELRKGIAVLKMRGSNHERIIREFIITDHGADIGEPFRTTTGILAGTPLELIGPEKERVEALFTGSPSRTGPDHLEMDLTTPAEGWRNP